MFVEEAPLGGAGGLGPVPLGICRGYTGDRLGPLLGPEF